MLRRPGYRCRQAPESSAYTLISFGVPKFLLLCILVAGLSPVSAFARLFGNSDTTVVSNQFQISAPEADVLEAVKHVSQDEIVHGTYVYEKRRRSEGQRRRRRPLPSETKGQPARSSTEVAKDVLDPRHFKGSNGVGTLTVRYVVNARGRTRLVFVSTQSSSKRSGVALTSRMEPSSLQNTMRCDLKSNRFSRRD